MANMLGRIWHLTIALALSCLAGGLHAQEKPESDAVRRRTTESRLVQIDKEVGELQAKLESEIKTSSPLLKACGNDIPRIQQWMDAATARLKSLEGFDAHASEVKTLKEELEKTRKEVLKVQVQADSADEALRRITTLQRQATELRAERERLALDLKSMWR
jgi:uncharacterized protein YlxW (UPF0749 family)